jgi:hypothetical protein
MSVIPALRKLRREDPKFGANKERPWSQKKKRKEKKKKLGDSGSHL